MIEFREAGYAYTGRKGLPHPSWGIALPPILKLIQELRERGHLIPLKVRSLHELQEFLLADPQSFNDPSPPQPIFDSP